MEQIKFYQGDPLARLLIDKLHLSSIKFALLAVLLTVGILFLAALISHTTIGLIGALKYWVTWIWLFLFVPTVAGYYIWISNAMNSLIISMKFIDFSIDEIESMLGLYKKPWRTLASITGSIIISIQFLFTRPGLTSWPSIGIIPKITGTIGVMITGYVGSMIGLTIILNAWSLQHYIRNKDIRINPLHPDRAGGLGVLGSYSLKTVYLAAVAGLVIGTTEYRLIIFGIAEQYWPVHMSIPIYVFWALFSFLSPLTTTHLKMKQDKEERMNDIAEKFIEEYDFIQQDINSDLSEIENGISKIKYLQELYDVTNKFPTWPFDSATLRRFLVSVSAPLIPPIIGLMNQALQNALFP